MVVHKVVEIKISHILEIFYSMCDFEIVVIVMSAVECFMQGIVCYTVERFSIYPSAVIAMDHFTRISYSSQPLCVPGYSLSRTETVPPAGVNLIALDKRFSST